MKMTALTILAAFMQVSALSVAQTVTLKKENVRLKTVFSEITRQTGFVVLAKSEVLESAKPVSVNLYKADIHTAIKETLKGQPMDFTIRDGTIVIQQKLPSFPESLAASYVDITVRGRVVDAQGNSLAGANVKVKGTNRSTVTNSDGEFTLSGVDENAVLVISFLGYDTREIKAAQNLGTVQMILSSAKLEEVSVVSTGYQSLPKERVTGSFSRVDNQTYNRQVSTDVISRLKGIAPSMLFDERNDGIKLSIRGRSTIFGNDQPLVVVDNFPYEGDLKNLNPNDIQDISILKDAAAASIWGVRAGNGVIVITTKRGSFNQPMTVGFNANLTGGEKPDLYYTSAMKPSDFIDTEIMLFDKGYFNTIINNTTSSPPISPVVEILLQKRNGQITADQANAQINTLRQFDLRDDMTKHYYQRSVNQQYALNLSGGTQKHNYYYSANYDSNKLSLVGEDFSRLTITANDVFRPLKNLEIFATLSYNQNAENENNGLIDFTFGDGRRIYPYARLTDDNGNAAAITKDFRNGFKAEAAQKGFLNWDFVPLDELEMQVNQNKQTSTRLLAGARYTLLRGLSAEVRFQYQRQDASRQAYQSQNTYYMRDLINRFTTISGSSLVRNVPLGGKLSFSNSVLQSLNGRAQLNFDREWKDHQLAAIAGFEARQTQEDGTRGQLYGYDLNTAGSVAVNYSTAYPRYPSGSTTIPRNDGAGGTLNRFRSYYSNLAYTYRSRYTASGSARFDQSNLFGVQANQKGVPLWSAGLKWDLARERFYHFEALPLLSLRTSYGYSGNLDNGVTAFTTAQVQNSSIVPQPAARIINPPNADLRWEKTATWNVGMDFGMKGNWLSGSIEYYTRRGKDLISTGYIDPTTGFRSFRGNLADMKGEGVDIEITSVNINSNNFTWRTNYLYSFTTDEITNYELLPDVNLIFDDASISRVPSLYSPIVGKPLFSIYSYEWAGLDPQTGAPRGYLDGQASTNYSAITAQVNTDLANRLVYGGRAMPPHFGALRNTFEYKGWEMSFNVTFRVGYFFRRRSVNYSASYSAYASHADYYDRWQQPGDEKRTSVPAQIYPIVTNSDNFYLRSTALVTRGDHVRLQDLNLGYSVREGLRGIGIRQLRIYMYLNNLGLIWSANKHNIDPDFPSMKLVRTAAIGLSGSF